MAFVVSSLATEVYEAQATVLVDPRTSTATREQEVLALPEDGTLRAWAVRAEAAILGSRDVAEAALATLSEEERSTLTPRPFWVMSLLGRLKEMIAPGEPLDIEEVRLRAFRKAVSIFNDPNTYILRVRAKASGAELAAKMSNAVVAAYVDVGLRGRRTEIARILTASRTELARVDAEIDATLNAVATLGASAGGSLDPALLSSRLAALYTQIETKRGNLLNRQLDLAAATSMDPLNLGAGLPVLDALRARLFSIEDEIDARTRLGTRLDTLPNEQNETRQALVTAAEQLIEQKREEVAAVSDQLDELEARAAGLEKQAASGLVAQSRLHDLDDRLTEFGARRSTLLARTAQMTAMSDHVQSDAVPIEQAIPPEDPLWPRPKLVAVLAGALGACSVLGVGLWQERRRTDALGIRPAPLPLIGYVPARAESPRDRDAYPEAVDAVRRSLEAMLPSRPRQLLLALAARDEDTDAFAAALVASFERAGVDAALKAARGGGLAARRWPLRPMTRPTMRPSLAVLEAPIATARDALAGVDAVLVVAPANVLADGAMPQVQRLAGESAAADTPGALVVIGASGEPRAAGRPTLIRENET